MNTDLNSITERIIGCAYNVSNTLGHGFLERVYQNALTFELRKSGIEVECQKTLKVMYQSIIVGEYTADMIVAQSVLVEIKAMKDLDDAHTGQCLNYLKATGLKLCLLINFGRPRVQIRRIISPFDLCSSVSICGE